MIAADTVVSHCGDRSISKENALTLNETDGTQKSAFAKGPHIVVTIEIDPPKNLLLLKNIKNIKYYFKKSRFGCKNCEREVMLPPCNFISTLSS